jgi:curved DNA-binding protein CbpA
MRLPRPVAAPVERVVSAYASDSTDLYDVLGVSRDADEIAVKAAFRAVALTVHPDKNPHPQAKVAFDALQEAFATLSNPIKRATYDESLARRRARRTPRRLLKRVRDELYNHYSRLLLLQHRLRHGRADEEIAEARQAWDAVREAAADKLLHLTLLPTQEDRVLLVNELWLAHWKAAVAVSLGLSAGANLLI